MTDTPVTWSITDAVATITLNRPEVLNAIDVPMAQGLARAVHAVVDSGQARAIVLRGAGRAFVAGGDVASFGADPARAKQVVNDILDAAHDAILTLQAQDAPVIAAVQGAAAGAGLSLVLGADLVVAAEDARFLMAYDKLGVPPDCGATWFLARKTGYGRAAELFYLSETLDAATAQAAGIVNRVVPAADLDRTVAEMAARVAKGPTRAYGIFRREMTAAATATLAEQLEAERAAFIGNTDAADFTEGVGAFLARRPADFSGR